MRRYKTSFFAGLCLITAALATAHEFWLQPLQFRVPVGATVAIQLLVGENFTGQPWAGNRRRLVRFVHVSPADTAGLLPTDTAAATTITFQQPGTHVVALATNNAYLTLPAGQFNAYLKAEGLDNALLLRQQRGQLAAPGREAYRRCAKTLVQAGPANPRDTARAYARPVGLPLELVPEQNPYLLRPGGLLTVRVLRGGLPLPGALVQVWQQTAGQPARTTKFYSNQNGRGLFRLSAPGRCLVSTVRMAPTPDPARADWQSTWASLTFGTGTVAK